MLNETSVKQIYSDGINHINFLNGMIRIGIGTLIPGENQDEEPTYNEEYRIIMPLNSCLAAFNSQQKLLAQLEEKQIITKQLSDTEQSSDASAVIPEVVK